MSQKKSITYHIYDEQKPLFFTKKINSLITDLVNSINNYQRIDVFPDATYKTPGLPNGLAITSHINDTILFPTLLRDPGCGFLLFKINIHSEKKDILNKMNIMLTDNVNSKFEKYAQKILSQYFNDSAIENILFNGITSFSNLSPFLECFTHTSFPVKKNISIQKEDLANIENDLLNVTNTVELKNISLNKSSKLNHINIENNDIIGFVHSGSDCFPKILAAKFYHRIVAESQKNNSFKHDSIQKGIFGITLLSTTGDEYYQWINIGMNFSLFNRLYIFLCIKELLENNFECEVSIVNDQMHAGAFVYDQQCISTRGVQIMTPHQNANKNIYLLAGHRETISVLYEYSSPSNNDYHLISHGSSYEIVQDYDYAEAFTHQEINYYLSLAHQTLYNTKPEFSQCIPYTFNLLTSLKYFQEQKIIRPLAILEPLINIQSASLVRRLCYFEQLQKENSEPPIPWVTN